MTDGIDIPGPFALSRLTEANHLLSAEGGWLVAVQFRFEEGYFGVEVDPGHDEVELSFDPSSRPTLRYWRDAVRRDAAGFYAGVLGQSSTWRWLLCNQQGYRDGFQIEFGPAQSTTTLQYLAIASRLQPRLLGNVTIGAVNHDDSVR
jgi:hypothetical protein